MSLPNQELPRSFVTPHSLPCGNILVAVVYMSKDYVVHAYTLDTYDTRGREQQWYAPRAACASEAAKTLAYGKGGKEWRKAEDSAPSLDRHAAVPGAYTEALGVMYLQCGV